MNGMEGTLSDEKVVKGFAAREHLKQVLKNKKPAISSEKMIETFIFLCGISSIIFIAGIFIFIFKEAAPFLINRFSFSEFLFDGRWMPNAGEAKYGAMALFNGTMAVTLVSMCISIPFGLGCAIYLSEFCSPRLKEVTKVIIESLAAIPSVVWGFIAITMINPLLIKLFNIPVGLNVLNAGIILAFMSIPVIVSLGEDALRSVPHSYIEAAYSMGATRWEVIYRVLLPAAKKGLMAAVLLGIGRAIGETMAVLMASGHSIRMVNSVLEPARTLTATIAAELGEAPKDGEHYRALFTIGLSLFTISFVINFLASRLIKTREKKKA
ncbi:MAG: phosphate ABC transporter permease subunit PstC [Bacteriovoracaceae bacterium]